MNDHDNYGPTKDDAMQCSPILGVLTVLLFAAAIGGCLSCVGCNTVVVRDCEVHYHAAPPPAERNAQ